MCAQEMGVIRSNGRPPNVATQALTLAKRKVRSRVVDVFVSSEALSVSWRQQEEFQKMKPENGRSKAQRVLPCPGVNR